MSDNGTIILDFCADCDHHDRHAPTCPRGLAGEPVTVSAYRDIRGFGPPSLSLVPPGAEFDPTTDASTLANAWRLARMSLPAGMLLIGIEVSTWNEAGVTWVAAASTAADWAAGCNTVSGEGATEVAALMDLADHLWMRMRSN